MEDHIYPESLKESLKTWGEKGRYTTFVGHRPNKGESKMRKTKTRIIWTGIGLMALVSLFSARPALSNDDLPPGISPKGEATNFKEHVARINATDKFLEAYGKLEDDHPVIHLNLLQWRPRGNGDRYGLYADTASGEIAALGGSTSFVGLGITDASKIYEFSDAWDEIAFVIYPRKRAYLQLQRDQAYQLAIPDRVAGTYRRMLYALSDGEPIYNATNTILDFHKNKTLVKVEKGNVVLSSFLRFKKEGGLESYTKYAKNFEKLLIEAGGYVSLSVNAEFPIVTQEYWDHFVAFVFPSRKVMEDLLTSDKFIEINVDRINGLDGSLAILANAVILDGK
jgi:uncharacterized protein (DUF1330 family)